MDRSPGLWHGAGTCTRARSSHCVMRRWSTSLAVSSTRAAAGVYDLCKDAMSAAAPARRTAPCSCSWNSPASAMSECPRTLSSRTQFEDTRAPVQSPENHGFSMRPARFLTPLLVLLSAHAFGQSRELATSGTLLDRVAAVVNDGVVLKSEVDEQVEMVTQRLQQQRTELPPANVLRQQILERLVVQEIQLQRADKGGVKVSDEMLNNSLRDVAERNKLSLDQLPSALESQGINYAAYRDSLRKEMTISLLRRRDVLERIIVTPREIDQYLAKQSGSIDNQEFNISHILVALPQAATPGQLEEANARAKDIYERAVKGENFAQLAVTYSNSQTALDGGSLGWRKGPQLPTFIADLVGHMQPGDIAEPVRTPSGFHIIKLNEKRGAEEQVMINQVHARHILMRPNELQDDATVKQKLVAIRKRILDGEDFA